jgi:hypothetical protein
VENTYTGFMGGTPKGKHVCVTNSIEQRPLQEAKNSPLFFNPSFYHRVQKTLPAVFVLNILLFCQ